MGLSAKGVGDWRVALSRQLGATALTRLLDLLQQQDLDEASEGGRLRSPAIRNSAHLLVTN